MPIHRFSRSALFGLLVITSLACGDPAEQRDLGSPEETSPTATAAEPPEVELPSIAASDFDRLEPVPLDERTIPFSAPVSLAAAKTWAEKAGFTIVLVGDEGDDMEEAYAYFRVLLEEGPDGSIISATVG